MYVPVCRGPVTGRILNVGGTPCKTKALYVSSSLHEKPKNIEIRGPEAMSQAVFGTIK